MTLLSLLHRYRVIHAEGGCEHSIAICEPGLLFTWGQGDGGRLGHGDEGDQLAPKLVQRLVDRGLRAIHAAAGDKYSMVLLQSQPKSELLVAGGAAAAGVAHGGVVVEGTRGGLSTRASPTVRGGMHTTLNGKATFDFDKLLADCRNTSAVDAGAEQTSKTTATGPVPVITTSSPLQDLEAIFLHLGQLSVLHTPLIHKMEAAHNTVRVLHKDAKSDDTAAGAAGRKGVKNPRANGTAATSGTVSTASANGGLQADIAPISTEPQPWAAFCIDSKVESLRAICHIIIFCTPHEIVAGGGIANASAAAVVSEPVVGGGGHKGDDQPPGNEASALPLAARWRIVMCCLFILQANLKALLLHDATVNKLCAGDEEWLAIIRHLHVVLRCLIEMPFDSQTIGAAQPVGAASATVSAAAAPPTRSSTSPGRDAEDLMGSTSNARNTTSRPRPKRRSADKSKRTASHRATKSDDGRAMRGTDPAILYSDEQKLLIQEAANTIRCGFEVFYSTPAARRDLLLHLMMRSNKVSRSCIVAGGMNGNDSVSANELSSCPFIVVFAGASHHAECHLETIVRGGGCGVIVAACFHERRWVRKIPA